MVRRFADNKTHPVSALQAWLILIGRATNRQTLTYEMLSNLMNYGSAVAMSQITDYIWCYCKINKLPPLTGIIVNKATGIPGIGMGDYTYAQQEAVFNFDWYGIIPPAIEELKAARNEIRS